MGGTHATLWMACGAALAAVGLYTLLNAGAGIRTAMQWFGWSLYGMGGVLIAGTVLESTGSFWNLLLFCALCTIALLCATISAVRQPGVDSPGVQQSAIRDMNWLLGAAAVVAAILFWRGINWTGGALLIVAVCLGTAHLWSKVERNSFRSFDAADGESEPSSEAREPGLACLMWGLLMWGLLRALQHSRPADGGVSPDAAWLNNMVAAGCGLLSLGVLQIVTRSHPVRRRSGIGSLLLGTLLVCSAGADRGLSEPLCLTALACVVVNGAVIVLAPRWQGPASKAISARGEA